MTNPQSTLYGVVKLPEGYRVFWQGQMDATPFATRTDAILELARRDQQPTPCQQQQARANAPQYAKVPPCHCDRLHFPHRRDRHCVQHEWDMEAERELAGVSRIGPDYGNPDRGAADALNAFYRGLDRWSRGGL